MSASPLRLVLESAMAEHGLSMKDLTVLDKATDPFRVDTPAGHRDGRWFADAVDDLGYRGRTIHLRGMHYMLLSRVKPDGTAYENTAKDWQWLVGGPGKAARFLAYVPFESIIDQRNAPPVIREFREFEPEAYLTVGINVRLPRADEIKPTLGLFDFTGVQPYRIVFVGEKSSLDSVLGPVAESYGADLYLPTGYMSDTMAHRLASTAADDGRPLAVLYFADCDPAGWHMPIEVGRKLQAFKALSFPNLEFEVHRVGLTPDQVRAYDLPSTPLKATEARAGAWLDATGVEQTEIDALASLRPDLLRDIAHEAVRPFYDATLDRRVGLARQDWIHRAQEMLADQLDAERLRNVQEQAGRKLSEMREQIAELNDQLRIDTSGLDLPPIEVPLAESGGGVLTPLIDSRWSFVEQCARLRESKGYGR